MKKNLKTGTDKLFEYYFKQQNTKFEYEPFSHHGTIPDYIFYRDKKTVLVECEEITKIPSDNTRTGAGSMDMNSYLKILRGKIYIASKQLKPYKDEVDYQVVILGKKSGFELDLNFLRWAMWGDPIITAPISTDGSKTRFKPTFDMKIKGALRKNDPKTKRMYFPHSYISAVGLIKQFNELNFYQRKLYQKYVQKEQGTDIKKNIKRAGIFFNEDWKKFKKEIPMELYNNPKKILYKLEIISNPLAEHPLPKNIFDGTWDQFVLPKVNQDPNLY